MEKPNISLNLIVRDSEDEIQRALESFKNIVTEMIVIDTGSKDNTIALAKESGARVYSFEWIDSFSAARNYAIEQSSCPWILWLDDDEWIDPENAEKLSQLKLSLSTYYYFHKRLVKSNIYREIKTNCVRLFPNRPDVRWRYRIHEDILQNLQLVGLQGEMVDIIIRNEGCPPGYMVEKGLYYKKFLEEDLKTMPDDPYILYHHGQECKGLKLFDQAEESFRKSILNFKDDGPFLPEAVGHYVHALIETGDLIKAANVLQPGLALYPHHPRLIDFQAIIERFMGNPGRAEELWKEVIALCYSDEINHQILNPVGVRIAAHNRLGDLYESQGKHAQAKEQWETILSIDPTFGPALEGIKRYRTG